MLFLINQYFSNLSTQRELWDYGLTFDVLFKFLVIVFCLYVLTINLLCESG